MTDKKRNDSAITLILVVVATTLVMPVYLYAINEGVNPEHATNIYIVGLLAGMVIMISSILINRRSNLKINNESNKNVTLLQFHNLKESKKTALLTLVVLLIIGAMLYPIRFYAHDAKALFFPIVYWAGVILGTSLIWILAGSGSSSKFKESQES